MQSFIKALRYHCAARKITLKQLCQLSGVSYVYLLNNRGLSLDQFNRLCQTLELDELRQAYLHTRVKLRNPRDGVKIDDAFVRAVQYRVLRNRRNWDDPAAVCAAVLRCAGVRNRY
jgi:transcriptional regulator with XRE-family HTH domain